MFPQFLVRLASFQKKNSGPPTAALFNKVKITPLGKKKDNKKTPWYFKNPDNLKTMVRNDKEYHWCKHHGEVGKLRIGPIVRG